MSQPSLKEKTAKGLLWGGIGNGALQLLNLAFGIFLSRLLTPADYGMVGALTIFSALAGIFAESGFILAIVNKKEVRHDDYNAVFWFNITVGGTLYLLLFACAPLIARFYHTPELAPLARFLFLSFLVGSTTAAPLAYYFHHRVGYRGRHVCLPRLGQLGYRRTDSCILGHERAAHLAALALEADILV